MCGKMWLERPYNVLLVCACVHFNIIIRDRQSVMEFVSLVVVVKYEHFLTSYLRLSGVRQIQTLKYQLKCVLHQRYTNFRKIQEPFQNSRRQKGDMQQVPYSRPTNIGRHSARFSRHGDLACGVCAVLPNSVGVCCHLVLLFVSTSVYKNFVI